MSDDAQAAARSASPVMFEMIDSLAADYKAGVLPDDVKERVEALRDEYVESFKERFTDLKNDVVPDIDAVVRDMKQQTDAYAADGGTLNSEVGDSRQIAIADNTVDSGMEKVIEPVIDAVEDVVHNTFDFVGDLLQIRAEHDPDGIYAAKLATAEEELDRVNDSFDSDMGTLHDNIGTLHENMEEVRADAEEFRQTHAPVQIIMSTTVDPDLPAQMAEETGEGAA